MSVCEGARSRARNTYKVSETVELLAKETCALAPASNLAVKEIEHQAAERQPQRNPEIVLVVGQKVPPRVEYRKCAAEAVHNRD